MIGRSTDYAHGDMSATSFLRPAAEMVRLGGNLLGRQLLCSVTTSPSENQTERLDRDFSSSGSPHPLSPLSRITLRGYTLLSVRAPQAASVAVPLVSCYLTEAAAAATISRRDVLCSHPHIDRPHGVSPPSLLMPHLWQRIPREVVCCRRGAAPEWRGGTVWQTRMACAGASSWLLWRYGGEVWMLQHTE